MESVYLLGHLLLWCCLISLSLSQPSLSQYLKNNNNNNNLHCPYTVGFLVSWFIHVRLPILLLCFVTCLRPPPPSSSVKDAHRCTPTSLFWGWVFRINAPPLPPTPLLLYKLGNGGQSEEQGAGRRWREALADGRVGVSIETLWLISFLLYASSWFGDSK